jgi:hypothetical protein
MTYYRLCHFDEVHTLNAAEHFLAPDDNRALEIAKREEVLIRQMGGVGNRPLRWRNYG